MSSSPNPASRRLEDVEPTTNLLLESRNRLRASAPVNEPIAAAPAPGGAVGPGESETRLAVHSSLASPSGGAAASPAAPIRVGQHHARIGPYQVVCELASGGMASVYLTLHRSVEGFQKLCAVKRIHPHLAGDRAFTEMFVDEAQIAARISHPYVCSVFSFGRSQDSHFIAMEFLRGEPLSAVSRRVARSPELGDDPHFPLLAARIIANLAEGLHAAHTLRDDKGALLDVVHRDVTPQNLFVMYDGSVRVTDFGIAQARQRLHHTQGQKLKGKLSYIAPELLNRGTASAQVDVWGLGVVMWELLAGRRLFLGSSEGETLAAVMSRVVSPPSEYRSSVPLELDRIVLRALERDPQHRYRTARDLARDLERFLKDSGDSVPAMDVADWMTRVFPEGAERLQGLAELAAHVSAATADETVVRIPSAPPLASSRDAMPSLPTLPVATTLYDPPPPPSAPTSATQAAAVDATALPPPRPRLETGGDAALGPATLAAPELAAQTQSSGRWRWLAVAPIAALAVLGIRAALPPDLDVPPSSDATVATHAAIAPAPGDVSLDAVSVSPVEVNALAAPEEGAAAGDVVALDSLPVLDEELEAEAPATPAKPRSTAPARGAAALAASPAAPSPQPAPAAAAAAQQGVVYVTTPGGVAEVSSGGRSLGRTPGKFRLSVGKHELVLRGDNGEHRIVSVSVAPESPTLVTVKLAP